MIVRHLPAVLALTFSITNSLAAQSTLQTPQAGPVEAVTELVFTEGPTYHPDGSVFFTDIANNRIMRWFEGADNATVFLQPSGRANGLLLDAQGRLLACEGNERGGLGGRRITRIDLVTRKRTVIVDRYEGKRFNSPNDLCLDRKGRIYFTDPYYGPDRDQLELDVEGVYRVDEDGKNIVRVLGEDRIARPNGLALSSDNKTLFVVDNHPLKPVRKLWAFPLNEKGLVAGDGRQLHDFGKGRGGDGMAIDIHDNLYVTAGADRPYVNQTTDNVGGVYVFSPQGKLLTVIDIPEDMVTNCCFGGKDRKTLLVTAGKTLWRVPMNIPGRLR